MSLIEAVSNVAVGFLVALLTQIIVFPLFNLEVSLDEHLAISGLFTIASIARSYALRRVFEAIRVAQAEPARQA
jgi:branched-subunit amino acid transport protein